MKKAVLTIVSAILLLCSLTGCAGKKSGTAGTSYEKSSKALSYQKMLSLLKENGASGNAGEILGVGFNTNLDDFFMYNLKYYNKKFSVVKFEVLKIRYYLTFTTGENGKRGVPALRYKIRIIEVDEEYNANGFKPGDEISFGVSSIGITYSSLEERLRLFEDYTGKSRESLENSDRHFYRFEVFPKDTDDLIAYWSGFVFPMAENKIYTSLIDEGCHYNDGDNDHICDTDTEKLYLPGFTLPYETDEEGNRLKAQQIYEKYGLKLNYELNENETYRGSDAVAARFI